MTPGAAVADFLGQKRFAMVGVSRDPKDFSRGLFKTLTERGYDVVPVNRNGGPVDGRHCFQHLREIDPPVQGALLMTPPAVTEKVVRECAEAGIGRVWMHRGGGAGAVSLAAVEFCREQGITVVPGACPYMFLPGGGLVHRIHGAVLRLLGKHPAHRRADA
jgi:uncharacterized protein